MRTPVLCYHRIAALPDTDPLKACAVSPQQFASQLAYLASRRCRTLTLSELAATADLSDRCVALTFDDGYLDVYDVALPVLRRYGFTATVFLVSGWLGANGGRAEAAAATLSSRHLHELVEHGIEFGAHGRSHRRLTELATNEAWDEVAGSKQDLESLLGRPVTAFAYPFGAASREIQAMVQAAGYRIAVAVGNGTDDPFNRHRIVVERGQNLVTFAWQVSPVRERVRWLMRVLPVRRPKRSGGHV